MRLLAHFHCLLSQYARSGTRESIHDVRRNHFCEAIGLDLDISRGGVLLEPTARNIDCFFDRITTSQRWSVTNIRREPIMQDGV